MICNRTVCNNKATHKHNFNDKLYCLECVIAIDENIALFNDPPCFNLNKKPFPIQKSRDIPWLIAEIAYEEYIEHGGRGQSLTRVAERGGFGLCEMDRFYPEWRDILCLYNRQIKKTC